MRRVLSPTALLLERVSAGQTQKPLTCYRVKIAWLHGVHDAKETNHSYCWRSRGGNTVPESFDTAAVWFGSRVCICCTYRWRARTSGMVIMMAAADPVRRTQEPDPRAYHALCCQERAEQSISTDFYTDSVAPSSRSITEYSIDLHTTLLAIKMKASTAEEWVGHQRKRRKKKKAPVFTPSCVTPVGSEGQKTRCKV